MTAATRSSKRRSRGMTLIELSLMLVVLGFVAMLLAELMPGFKRVAMQQESSRALDTAQLGLRGFVLINGRLPCPDSTDDGKEDLQGADCVALTGTLPYRSLGLAGALKNASGFPFRYGVFSRNSTLGANDSLTQLIDRLQPQVADNLPPTMQARTHGNLNMLDFCAALESAQALNLTDTARIHVALASTGATENVAYVLAEPGVADMNVNGSPFDGSNKDGVRFEHPTRAPARDYDDRVVVAYFSDLWEALSCSGLVASAARAYPNTESGLALFRQAMRDYKAQLELTREMAEADRLQEIASLAQGVGSTATAVAALPIGIASSINTSGATASSPVLAGIAIGLNAAAAAVAAVGLTKGDTIRKQLDARLKEASDLITELDTLHTDVKRRAHEADGDAFSAQ